MEWLKTEREMDKLYYNKLFILRTLNKNNSSIISKSPYGSLTLIAMSNLIIFLGVIRTQMS